MSTLKERAPYLFEVDPQYRPLVPTPATAIPAPIQRIPSPLEVINHCFSAHHIIPDRSCALDILASLDELSKIAKTAPAPAQEDHPAPSEAWQGRRRWTPPVPPAQLGPAAPVPPVPPAPPAPPKL